MPTAHCVSSADGVIMAADQGFIDLVGRPQNEVIGASYRDLTHPADLAISKKMLASLVDRAPPISLQKRYLRPDGTSVTATVFVTYFADPDRLISTLFWNEAGRDAHPERLWEAALRIRHVQSVSRAALGDELVTDPAISLLVTIYLAEAEGRIAGVDRLAKEAGMSVSTATRWLRALQQRGIIEEEDHASNVQFTRAGMIDMERILGSVFHTPTLLSPVP